MERVVTINLNGNSYQLEEPAYDALRNYIAHAEAALSANPDKAEIIRDLEQAIADKCAGYLSPSKSVVNAEEMTRILEEMGPVEGAAEAPAGSQSASSDDEALRPHRRLYRIYDRHAWTGVSAGLAAFAGIDALWVRILWVLSAFFTGGFTILIYLVMIFALPVASTSAEMAAAHGAPFNAQEIVERAKREYGRFADESARSFRREERAWRRQWRETQRSWNEGFRWGGAPPVTPSAPAQPVSYFERMFAGLFALVFSVITAALLIGFLIAFFSLLGSGAIFGWAPPADIPLWLALVTLCIAYAAISSPFSALRRASFATLSGRRHNGGGGGGAATLVIVLVIAWFAWAYSSDARLFMEQAYLVLRDFVSYWRDFW